MWKFSVYVHESDKEKQELVDFVAGYLECFGLNSAEGFFYILIVKKQCKSISVWCANINSFKGKVSLAPCLSYLAALREGTPDFGYTSVSLVCQGRDAAESFSSETRQHCLQQRASQVKYWELHKKQTHFTPVHMSSYQACLFLSHFFREFNWNWLFF